MLSLQLVNPPQQQMILLLWVTISFSALILADDKATSTPPNIIFMMADDLGYHDLACYGQVRFPTPHTDKLAKQGIRLTAAYSPSSVCSPTRYAVLTGTDPFRRYITSHVLFNGESLVIQKGEETVASFLKKEGYATGVVGKWHLGLGDINPRDLNHPGRGPNEIGFDESFLVPDGHNMTPHVYHENGMVLGGIDPIFESELKIVDRLGCKFIQHIPKSSWEMRRPGEGIGLTLADKADEFLEKNAKKPFFLYYPTCSIHTPFVPQQKFIGKSGIGPHGDFVMEFDWAVGRVMSKLKELNLEENTLLIVTSDNGGLKTVKGHRPSDPWRGNKGTNFEGGHRVPFLARWPNKIKSNSVNDAYVSLVDLFATVSKLTGITLDKEIALDSCDMLPVLMDQPRVRDYVVTGSRGMTSLGIRQGDWKMICNPLSFKSAKLYNLMEDPQESKDLVKSFPAKAKSLWELLHQYIDAGSSRKAASKNPTSIEKLMAQKEKRNLEIKHLIHKAQP